jgi:tetratricopeptide (TPR) repeat protein
MFILVKAFSVNRKIEIFRVSSGKPEPYLSHPRAWLVWSHAGKLKSYGVTSMIKGGTIWAASMALCAILAQDWDRAISLYNQKQYRAAIREFHAVLRANQDYWQAWYYIGASHFELKSYEDAIDAFQNYVRSAQGRQREEAVGRYFIGVSYYHLGQYEKAIAELKNYLNLIGQVRASADISLQASLDREEASGHYFIGLAHYQLKQYDKAAPELLSYITASERLKEAVEPAARAALGRCYIFANRFSEAIPMLTTAAAQMKNNASNYYYLGYAQHRLGRDDQAIVALKEALAIDPKDADSLLLLGQIYLMRSTQGPAMIKQAVEIGDRLLAVRDDEYAWDLLGRALLLDGQYDKAAPLLEKVARAHQDSAPAWFNFGLALSRSGEWARAAEALERAVSLAPNNVVALLELGYVYESSKQFEKALAAYQRAYQASGRRDEGVRASIERVKQAISKPQ